MPNTAEPQNINYQPKIEGFIFINKENIQEKKPNILLTLTLGIIGFLLFFLIFLLALNYLSIISLNSLNPTLFSRLAQLKTTTIPLPKSIQSADPRENYYSKNLERWITTGKIKNVSQNSITIRNSYGITQYELNANTKFTIIQNNISTGNGSSVLGQISQLDISSLTIKDNIGKYVQIYYVLDPSFGTRLAKTIFLSDQYLTFPQ